MVDKTILSLSIEDCVYIEKQLNEGNKITKVIKEKLNNGKELFEYSELEIPSSYWHLASQIIKELSKH